MKRFALGLCLLLLGMAHAVAVNLPAQWWKAPGSLASYDSQWRKQYLQNKKVANAFAGELQASQKSGKGMAYLDQGGVSPSWYSAPLQVQPFPGRYAPKLYALAYSAFLQSHDLHQAYRLAYTAVQLRPDDPVWRQRLIQVATWLGQREEVLRQWHWLATHGDASAQSKAVTLALTLSRPDLVVQMLSAPARGGCLSDADWKSLIFAYGELGEPDKALQDIDAALKRYGPNRFLLAQKAYLSYQLGDIEHSLRALESSTKLYGPDPERAIEEARLLSMRGNYRLAFLAMERALPKATMENVPFWQLYAALAWEIHNNPAAFHAEKTLYLLGAASQDDLQRLVLLSGKQEPKAALAVALHGWHRYHLPLFYFDALYYGATAKKWDVLGKLLHSVPADDPDGIRNFTAYWMALGQWANARNDYPLAERAYAHLLRINPGDTLAESNLLWMLIDSGQVRTLRALLVGNTAQPEPVLRDAVLNALERLHLNQQALVLAAAVPSVATANRATRLLNQASLWDTAGQRGLAWSLRRQGAWQSLQNLSAASETGSGT